MQSALAARYLPLAVMLGMRFADRWHLNYQDVLSHLDEQLCVIARGYDASRGKPGGYFSARLNFALGNYWRLRRRKKQLRFEPSVGRLDRSDEGSQERAIEDRDRAEHLLGLIPADIAAILVEHHVEMRPMSAIAADRGLSKSCVSVRVRKAIGRLKAHSRVDL